MRHIHFLGQPLVKFGYVCHIIVFDNRFKFKVYYKNTFCVSSHALIGRPEMFKCRFLFMVTTWNSKNKNETG